MNNQNNQPSPLAERSDIHKSCKSLETLLNILNDYCEAATAIVALQKKLAKALRETANSKVTNEIAANALTASANIFEALVEVDGKFIKIADKEYDAISTEVKRWFKRLTKEEKAHDERIASANAKIKQAGLTFEKKSKKKSIDAHEEHSRYIQLISTLGPEVTQEKYNHSLQATHGHTTTILSVAACLARIADTEWARTCESVRRFAPTIGPLGEWRSLCEGGWTKDVPGDLANPDEKTEDKLKLNTIQEERVEVEEEDQDKRQYQHPQQRQHDQLQVYDNIAPGTYRRSSDGAPTTPESQHEYQHQLFSTPPRSDREATTSTSASYPSQPQSSSGNSPTLQRRPPNSAHSSTASLDPSALPARAPTSPQAPPPNRSNENLLPPSPLFHHPRSLDQAPATDDRERLFSDPVTGSVRSLSAFPAPPTHFPLPPPRPKDFLDQPPIKESREEQTYAAKHRLSESPLPMESNEPTKGNIKTEGLMPPPTRAMSSDVGGGGGGGDPRLGRQRSNSALDIPSYSPTPGSPNPNTISAPIPTAPTRPANFDRSGNGVAEGDEFHAREFGMLREERGAAAKARTFNGGDAPLEGNIDFPSTSAPIQRRGLVERTDTGSTTASGSVVAAMRNRYSNAPGSRSPPPRSDLPRLHTSVTEIATRYQSSPPPASIPLTTNRNIDNSEPGFSQSPRIPQSSLIPMSKSPPPGMARNISLPPTPEKNESRQHGGISSSSLTPTISPRPLSSGKGRESLDEAEDRMQRRRFEESARVKERELREREQEIAMRERELERDRVRLLALRDGLAPPSSSTSAAGSDRGSYDHSNMAGIGAGTQERGNLDMASLQAGSQLQPRPRERRISWRRSRQDSQPQTPQMRQDQLQPPSRSPLQGLIPSSSNPNLRERHQSHHSFSSPPPSSPQNNPDFSTSSTSGSNNSYLSRSTGSPASPDQPQQHLLAPEKKGGWMRRLSMPVGNAFSLDSSKRHVNNSNSSATSSTSPSSATAAGLRQLGAGIVGGKGVVMPDEKRFGQYKDRDREQGYQSQQQQQQEQDGGRFGGFGVGLARRSYDASRSATNLSSGLGSRK